MHSILGPVREAAKLAKEIYEREMERDAIAIEAGRVAPGKFRVKKLAR